MSLAQAAMVESMQIELFRTLRLKIPNSYIAEQCIRVRIGEAESGSIEKPSAIIVSEPDPFWPTVGFTSCLMVETEPFLGTRARAFVYSKEKLGGIA